MEGEQNFITAMCSQERCCYQSRTRIELHTARFNDALDEVAQDLVDSSPQTIEEWMRHVRNGLMPTIKYFFCRLDGDGIRRKLINFYRAASSFYPCYARTVGIELAKNPLI